MIQSQYLVMENGHPTISPYQITDGDFQMYDHDEIANFEIADIDLRS